MVTDAGAVSGLSPEPVFDLEDFVRRFGERGTAFVPHGSFHYGRPALDFVITDEVPCVGEPHRRRVLWGARWRADDVQIGSAEDRRLEADRKGGRARRQAKMQAMVASIQKAYNRQDWTSWHITVPASAAWKIGNPPTTMGEMLDAVSWDWRRQAILIPHPAMEAATISQKHLRRKKLINRFMAGVEHAILIGGGSITGPRYRKAWVRTRT